MLDYFFADWILPVDRPPIEQGFVAVEAGQIVVVGAISELPESQRPTRDTQIGTTLLCPGFVNAHTHLELSFNNQISTTVEPEAQPATAMGDWLLAVVNKTREAATPKEKLSRCRIGVAEMMRSGTTCINDITSDGGSVVAMAEAGIRGLASLEFFHPAFAVNYDRIGQVVKDYDNLMILCAPHPLIQAGLSPHSPYNVSPNAWQAVVESCHPTWIHTHLAESLDEAWWVTGKPDTGIHRLHQALLGKPYTPASPGRTPVDYLAEHQLLQNHMIAAHGVYCDPADILTLSQHGVRIAHCPRSNQWLQQSTIDWLEWEAYPHPVGLGTDSRLSTADLDMRTEARAAMAVHGWKAEKALQKITLDGAQVMGLEDQIGTLSTGKAADMVLWSSSQKIEPGNISAQFLDPKTGFVVKDAWVTGEALTLTKQHAKI